MITPVAKTMWTPQGEVPLREKGVETLSREEIIVLSKMHEIAHHRQLSIVCMRCNVSMTGKNNDTSKVLAIGCQCRELRFDGR